VRIAISKLHESNQGVCPIHFVSHLSCVSNNDCYLMYVQWDRNMFISYSEMFIILKAIRYTVERNATIAILVFTPRCSL